MDAPSVALNHPRFRVVEAAIFTRRLTADCMTHRCRFVPGGGATDFLGGPDAAGPGVEKLDACCQYGCDVDQWERAAIEARGDQIRGLLRAEVKDAPWFGTEVTVDADYPSGSVVRTEVHGGGCIFLAHDLRGCAIHRASIEGAWDFRGVKPAICRLFPLSYEHEEIMIAEEYPEYSCAHVDGPTLYRLTRDTFAELFGEALVVALDDAEARVLAAEAQVAAAAPRRLPLAP